MSTFDYTGFKLGEKKVLKENEVTHAPAEVPSLPHQPGVEASSSQHFAQGLRIALNSVSALFCENRSRSRTSSAQTGSW